MAGVGWVTAFLDTPEELAPRADAFWCAVSGSVLSARRGKRSEFATFLPGDGDPYLRAQTVIQSRPGGLHLDLHTDDVDGLAARAEALGASASFHESGFVVCGSPGGMTFCIVGLHEQHVPTAQPWPTGRSIVDQVCLDIPPSDYDAEVGFWRDLTGWEVQPEESPGFVRLARPGGMPLQFLFQRLADEQYVVTGHLDLGCDDRDAEVRRHLDLGAAVVRRTEGWTTLRDPAGRDYCVTTRGVDRPR
jgi:hypothetical protein